MSIKKPVEQLASDVRVGDGVIIHLPHGNFYMGCRRHNPLSAPRSLVYSLPNHETVISSKDPVYFDPYGSVVGSDADSARAVLEPIKNLHYGVFDPDNKTFFIFTPRLKELPPFSLNVTSYEIVRRYQKDRRTPEEVQRYTDALEEEIRRQMRK